MRKNKKPKIEKQKWIIKTWYICINIYTQIQPMGFF